MSDAAPWIAIAIDTFDSEMFDDAAHGERLAWVCLLFFAKAQGRAGRVKFRDKTFAEKYRLTSEAVSGMLERARHAGALTVDGNGVVTVVNWSRYQDPKRRSSGDDNHKPSKQLEANDTHFSKTSATETETRDRPETRDHPPPNTRGSEGSGVSKKPRLGDLDESVLADLPAYRAWIARERGYRKGLVRSDDDEQFALAAREKAISDSSVNEPIAYVKGMLILKRDEPAKAWSRIETKYVDAAQASKREQARSYHGIEVPLLRDASQL